MSFPIGNALPVLTPRVHAPDVGPVVVVLIVVFHEPDEGLVLALALVVQQLGMGPAIRAELWGTFWVTLGFHLEKSHTKAFIFNRPGVAVLQSPP